MCAYSISTLKPLELLAILGFLLVVSLAFFEPTFLLLLLSLEFLVSTIWLEASFILRLDEILGVFYLLLAEPLQASCSLLLQLFWRKTGLCSFVEHAKSLLTLCLLGFDGFLSLDTKTLLSSFNLCFFHFIGHNSEAFSSILFLFLLNFELRKAVHGGSCAVSCDFFSVTLAKPNLSELFSFLMSQLANFLRMCGTRIISTRLIGGLVCTQVTHLASSILACWLWLVRNSIWNL